MSQGLSLLQRIQQGFAAKEKPTRDNRVHQNVRHTSFDTMIWSRIRENDTVDEDITDLYTGGNEPDGTSREGYEGAPELIQDLAYALYKVDPHLEDEEVVHDSAKLNRKILQQVMESPNFEALHDKTATDPLMTTIALAPFTDVVKEIIVKMKEEVEQSNKKRGNEGDGGEPGDGDGDNPGGGSGGTSETPPVELPPDLERQLERAAHKAEKEINNIEDTMNGFGFGKSVLNELDPASRLETMNQLNSQYMRELASVVGRMRRFAMGVRSTRVTDAKEEITDVETGRDLLRLLKSQYALLATPETKYEFARRFAEGSLFQFERGGEESAGKGPMVVCVDRSGSMGGNNKMMWAVAVAESLRRIAEEERRDVHVIYFDSYTSPDTTFEFPEGKAATPKELIEFLSVGPYGGTNFHDPLNKAFELVMDAYDDGNGKTKADIVFITDGISSVDRNWLEEFNTKRTEAQCTVYGMFVTGAHDAYGGWDRAREVLESFSDVTLSVSDLTNEEASAVFRGV